MRGERGGPDYRQRFEIRIVPSPDGCSAALLLLADEVPIRVPSGRYAMQVVYAHRKGSLPSLVDLADPGRTASTVSFTFEQTLGRPWHA